MSSDVKTTTFSPAETESVGDKLGYGKDSKERLPWEHYLSQYQESDPKEIAARRLFAAPIAWKSPVK